MKPIPKLEERHSKLEVLYEKQNALNTRFAEKTKEKVELSQRNRDNPNPGNIEINRLRRLLNQPTEPDVAPDRERLPELVSDLEALKRALDETDSEIQKEKAVASRLICQDASGEHTKLVKQFASALVDLHGAHERYVEFLDAVERTGASLSPLQPVSPYTLGHPRSTNGTYWWSLREFLDNGHIQKHDFPESLR